MNSTSKLVTDNFDSGDRVNLVEEVEGRFLSVLGVRGWVGG